MPLSDTLKTYIGDSGLVSLTTAPRLRNDQDTMLRTVFRKPNSKTSNSSYDFQVTLKINKTHSYKHVYIHVSLICAHSAIVPRRSDIDTVTT